MKCIWCWFDYYGRKMTCKVLLRSLAFCIYYRNTRGEKCVKNEVYEKSSNSTLHFIEYRGCLICETKGGKKETCQGRKSPYSHVFKVSCHFFFSIYKNLNGKWQNEKCSKLYYLIFLFCFVLLVILMCKRT